MTYTKRNAQGLMINMKWVAFLQVMLVCMWGQEGEQGAVLIHLKDSSLLMFK